MSQLQIAILVCCLPDCVSFLGLVGDMFAKQPAKSSLLYLQHLVLWLALEARIEDIPEVSQSFQKQTIRHLKS